MGGPSRPKTGAVARTAPAGGPTSRLGDSGRDEALHRHPQDDMAVECGIDVAESGMTDPQAGGGAGGLGLRAASAAVLVPVALGTAYLGGPSSSQQWERGACSPGSNGAGCSAGRRLTSPRRSASQAWPRSARSRGDRNGCRRRRRCGGRSRRRRRRTWRAASARGGTGGRRHHAPSRRRLARAARGRCGGPSDRLLAVRCGLGERYRCVSGRGERSAVRASRPASARPRPGPVRLAAWRRRWARASCSVG